MAKILLVEDNHEVAELVGFNLEQAGHQVATASTASDALRLSPHFLPDLILLDVLLPDLDGLTTCQMLRRQPNAARIPILITTALGNTASRAAAFEAGASDYLAKPYRQRDMVRRVEALLDQWSQEASPHIRCDPQSGQQS